MTGHPNDATASERGKGRIAYPSKLWVAVPMELFDYGLLRQLRGIQVRLFLALLREANRQRKSVGQKFQVTLYQLQAMCGASQRTAYRGIRGLEARKVIWFTSDTKPFTYILNLPSEWVGRNGQRLDTPWVAPVWSK